MVSHNADTQMVLMYSWSQCVSSDNVCRADSVTWNPHKSLGVPLQCSAFLTTHEGLLASCNSTKASYLFQQDKVSYDVSYDTGDKSIQCGRLNDVFKLWLMWKKKVHVQCSVLFYDACCSTAIIYTLY